MNGAPGPRLMVVVPTRNRAGLAAAALRSVRDQGAGVRLVVSDNSTEPSETASLLAACREQDGADYVRPPEPLPMSSHWEWAMNAAREISRPTHVTFLTDRMLFRPDSLRELLARVERHPHRVISYNHDHVDDLRHPVLLYQKRGTGRLFRVPAPRLLERAARSVPLVCAPRMLNCVVPVMVLEAVRQRFGSLFHSSISPDFCFAFRCLAVVDEILYWDRSPLVHYAMDRSNGVSTVRGVPSADSLDFLRSLGGRPLNHAAPVPAFRTVNNAIIHEYSLVRRQLGGGVFPEVDRGRYLQAIAAEVREIEDAGVRAEMERVLAAQGRTRGLGSRAQLLRRLKRLTAGLSAPPLQPLWHGLSRRFGVWPPGENALQFPSVEAALDHARRFPRRRHTSALHLRFLLGPLEPAD
jgi:hypothetical protein